MESSSIMYRDPELEASFSFNLFALHVFSDEDDDDNDEEEEYFEIALEEQPRNNFNNDDGDDDDGSPQELELRISFGLSRKSIVESLGNVWETATPTPTSSSSSSSSSSYSSSSSLSSTTSTFCCSCRAVEQYQPSITHKTITVKRRVQFRAVNPLFHCLFSSPTMTSSEHVKRTGTSYESNRTKADGKMTKATKGGGMMMKFLIKCRSINFRAVVASLMKPYQTKLSSPQGDQRKKKKKKRFEESTAMRSLVMKPFDEWFVQRERTNYNNNCPSSSNNHGGDSRSIQAAIAHCKRSCGQTF